MTSHQAPCNLSANPKEVHGHPEFSAEFIEEKLGSELVHMRLCTEELLHETEQLWKSVANPKLLELRELCQNFLAEHL